MIILISNCNHCGTKYHYQASGSYSLDTPQKYNDKNYCDGCEKAIIEALDKIPVKFKNKFVSYENNDVTLELLLEWDKLNKKEYRLNPNNIFPNAERVFCTLYSSERKEHQVKKMVIGRDKHKNKKFLYSYWPSKLPICDILVEMRVNLETNEPVEFIYK